MEEAWYVWWGWSVGGGSGGDGRAEGRAAAAGAGRPPAASPTTSRSRPPRAGSLVGGDFQHQSDAAAGRPLPRVTEQPDTEAVAAGFRRDEQPGDRCDLCASPGGALHHHMADDADVVIHGDPGPQAVRRAE